MKTFKQFLNNINNKKTFLYEGLPNTHGSHSLTDDEKEYYNFLREKEKLNENSKNLEDWLDRNDNKHLGSNNKWGVENHEQIENLIKEHPKTYSASDAKANNALSEFTMDSKELNKSLLNGTHYDGFISIPDLKRNFIASKNKFTTYSGAGYNLDDVKPVGKSSNGNNIYHSPCFISSSISKHVARNFANQKAYNGKTTIPTIHEYHVDPEHNICIVGNRGTMPDESEIIHPNDHYYEHTGTTYLKDEENDGKPVKIHHFKRVNFNKN